MFLASWTLESPVWIGEFLENFGPPLAMPPSRAWSDSCKFQCFRKLQHWASMISCDSYPCHANFGLIAMATGWICCFIVSWWKLRMDLTLLCKVRPTRTRQTACSACVLFSKSHWQDSTSPWMDTKHASNMETLAKVADYNYWVVDSIGYN